jgi:hypothetical protein
MQSLAGPGKSRIIMPVTNAQMCGQLTGDESRTIRDGGDGWNATQVVCHLRDFEALFLQRARMTVEQEYPDLPFPDPDELAVEQRYDEQDIDTAFADWQRHREDHLFYLRELDEDQWERAARHPKRGHFTLHDQLLLTTLHDMLHMEQMTKILQGRG